MNSLPKLLAAGLVAAVAFASASCQKQEQDATPVTAVPAEVLSQIKALGYSTADALRTSEGYLVEGDILLTNADLATAPTAGTIMRVAGVEQYRATNFVTGLPRTITISMDVANFSEVWRKALDEAIRRYNAVGLDLSFQRVSSGGMIKVLKDSNVPNGLVAEARFPKDGNPGDLIRINPARLTQPNSVNYAASLIAHEIGHCIGYRHTDYMNRSYSCPSGGAEGAWVNWENIGVVHISGTPTDPEAGSWMLACLQGKDRPFTANDLKALRYLYEL